MSERIGVSPFWAQRGPLQSLSCAVLFIAASDRLSHALIVSLSVFLVYSLSPLFSGLGEQSVPGRVRIFIRVITVSAVGAVVARIAVLFWPVAANSLTLYLGAVPVCLLASGLLDSAEARSPLRSAAEGAQDALVVALLTVSLALIREPLGYGVLSLPARDGYLLLFRNDRLQAAAAHAASATAGALILLAYVLALYRCVRFRLYGIPVNGEGE